MDIKDALFVEKLGNVSIKEIIRSAKERKGGTMGFSEPQLPSEFRLKGIST